MMDAILNMEPNWHPVIVHFAFGLLATAALVTLAAAITPGDSKFRFSLQSAGDWMLAIGLVSAIAAVLAGLDAYYSVNHDGPSHAAMTEHRNWAFGAAAVFLALGLWRLVARNHPPSILYAVALLVAAGLLTATAWRGGKLVYHHGLGVASLPAATGEGHDHEHAPGEEHDAPASAAAASAEGDGHDHGDHDHDDAAGALAQAGDAVDGATAANTDYAALSPQEVVEAFHAALDRGDEAAVRALLLPDVYIAESGGVERSMEEYAGHHMPADMAFSEAVSRNVTEMRGLESGDLAVFMSEAVSHGAFRGSEIHSRTMETMVVRRTDAGWRIAHIHWSSAPIRDENHEH